MYILEQQQGFAAPPEQLWQFIQNPANLNAITPEDLDFRILTEVPPTMYNGLIIEYRVSVPLFGRQEWVTEIKHIRQGYSFVDEQRLGPYRFWYHYHALEATRDGTLMLDRVHYALDWGPVGRLVHALFVRKTLRRIFDYRRQRLAALFGE